MSDIKFLSSGSPKFNAGEDFFQVKVGFNEMPEKFTKDPYYKLCLEGGIIKDFVSIPSDKQQEDFDKQIQAERDRADALQKEVDELKSAKAGQKETKESNAGNTKNK